MTGKQGFDDIRGSGSFRSVGSPSAKPMSEIKQTRAELTETIGAIQERLAPQGIADGATNVVADGADRSLAMAREIVEHTVQEATKQAKLAIIEITAQAQESARDAAREMADQAKASMRSATIGKVERMATSTSEMAKQAATTGSDKAKEVAGAGGETAKGVASGIVTTIKQNPWPAAVTALGIGWLVSSGSGAKSGGTPTGKMQPASTPPEYGTTPKVVGEDKDAIDRTKESAGEELGLVGATTGQAIDQAQDVVGTVAGTATEAVGKVAGTATGAVGKVGSAVGGAAGKVKAGVTGLTTGVQQGTQQISGMVTQSPLKVGVVTLAVGGALGLVLPVSQRETALIGETRDKTIDKLEKSTQETLGKLKIVANEAGEAASKEAKYQGLAPEEG